MSQSEDTQPYDVNETIAYNEALKKEAAATNADSVFGQDRFGGSRRRSSKSRRHRKSTRRVRRRRASRRHRRR